MHSLPCANGGEDGVCVALTRLSKELLENDANTQQAGGCDSSDCLFCQYRSNSPFHLNAYAGKLTSLFRKRSLNGMTLASLNSLIDTSSEQSASLLAAAATSIGSGNKRHRSASSHGHIAAASGPAGFAPGSSSAPATVDAASANLLAAKASAHPHPTSSMEISQDCEGMCGARLCAADNFPNPCEVVEQSETGDVEVNPMARASSRKTALPGAFMEGFASGSAEARLLPSGADAGGLAAAATTLSVDDTGPYKGPVDSDAMLRPISTSSRAPPDTPGLGPSSASLLQHLQNSRRSQSPPLRCHQHQHDSSHHTAQQELRSSVHQTGVKLPPADGPRCEQRPLPSIRQHQDLHQGRMLCGRPLPEGWTFRAEWRHRADPAPAVLWEVLHLPSAASYGARPDARYGFRQSVPAGGGAGGTCGGSAGIVCALEFSPDGRLLAAGGVDKQIRLYNLSSAFGELDMDDDDEEEYDDDDCLMGVESRYLGSRSGSTFTAAPWGAEAAAAAAGGSTRHHGCSADGCSRSSDEADGGDHPYSSILAAVQRMPSKISSMAWSPYLDGVLTVGDYDGVLLQLHIASGHQLADVDAHGGRKIWSVAHSRRIPHLAASTADDRCARLWAGRGLAECVSSVQPNPRASVCSVDFSPACDHLLALACSDRTAYLYDMRSLGRGPLAALRHHSRPTSYCRFLGGDRLVTAATDASLALWDISEAIPALTGIMHHLPSPGCVSTPGLQGAAVADLGLSSSPPRKEIVQEYRQAPWYRLSHQVPGACRAVGEETSATGASSEACLTSSSKHGSGVASACALFAPVTQVGVDGGDGSSGSGRASLPTTAGAIGPCRIFRGHKNEKNFVGLSVRAEDGLLACGSECSRAFAYHTSWSDPLATLELLPAGTSPGEVAGATDWLHPPPGLLSLGALERGEGRFGGSGFGAEVGNSGGSGVFVSAVCWQPWEAALSLGLPPLLASATSQGVVSVNVLAAQR